MNKHYQRPDPQDAQKKAPVSASPQAYAAAPAQTKSSASAAAGSAAPAAAAQSPRPANCSAQPRSTTSASHVTVPLEAWQLAGAAVAGLSHWRKGLPCQDAVAWRAQPRPILALSDGAGSASASERGAHALVTGVVRYFASLNDLIAPWLDENCENAESQLSAWSRRLLAHAQGILNDLAAEERRPVADLRATLQVVLIGTVRTFWWQVGDGSTVARCGDEWRVLGMASRAKGEFANQTCFVDGARLQDVQCGLIFSEELSGLALMSDGGAERLVSFDGQRVGGRLGQWLALTAQGRMSADQLAVAYHEHPMWERTSLDDRSIILAARLILPVKQAQLPCSSSEATAPLSDATALQTPVASQTPSAQPIHAMSATPPSAPSPARPAPVAQEAASAALPPSLPATSHSAAQPQGSEQENAQAPGPHSQAAAEPATPGMIIKRLCRIFSGLFPSRSLRKNEQENAQAPESRRSASPSSPSSSPCSEDTP